MHVLSLPSAAIFYHTEEQKTLAEDRVAAETKRLGKQVVTEVVPFTKWWPAEEYHQKYLEKGGQVRWGAGGKRKATEQMSDCFQKCFQSILIRVWCFFPALFCCSAR